MLNLVQAYVGSPIGPFHHLSLNQQSIVVSAFPCPAIFHSFSFVFYFIFQIYPSADAVVLLNAHSLAVIRVLAFAEAFPGTSHHKRGDGNRIGCISVDSGMKLVRSMPRIPICLSEHLTDSCVHAHSCLCLVPVWHKR